MENHAQNLKVVLEELSSYVDEFLDTIKEGGNIRGLCGFLLSKAIENKAMLDRYLNNLSQKTLDAATSEQVTTSLEKYDDAISAIGSEKLGEFSQFFADSLLIEDLTESVTSYAKLLNKYLHSKCVEPPAVSQDDLDMMGVTEEGFREECLRKLESQVDRTAFNLVIERDRIDLVMNELINLKVFGHLHRVRVTLHRIDKTYDNVFLLDRTAQWIRNYSEGVNAIAPEDDVQWWFRLPTVDYMPVVLPCEYEEIEEQVAWEEFQRNEEEIEIPKDLMERIAEKYGFEMPQEEVVEPVEYYPTPLWEKIWSVTEAVLYQPVLVGQARSSTEITSEEKFQAIEETRTNRSASLDEYGLYFYLLEDAVYLMIRYEGPHKKGAEVLASDFQTFRFGVFSQIKEPESKELDPIAKKCIDPENLRCDVRLGNADEIRDKYLILVYKEEAVSIRIVIKEKGSNKNNGTD